VRLQKALKEALAKEDYESAARYRDELRALKEKTPETSGPEGGKAQ